MHQCMDMHPISTCTRAEEQLGRGVFCFPHWGESCLGDGVGRLGGELVINTPGPGSPGRLEARLVTRVNTRGTWPLTLLMGHRKPSTNWYPLCRIPPQDLSHQPPSAAPTSSSYNIQRCLWIRPQNKDIVLRDSTSIFSSIYNTHPFINTANVLTFTRIPQLVFIHHLPISRWPVVTLSFMSPIHSVTSVLFLYVLKYQYDQYYTLLQINVLYEKMCMNYSK